MQEKPEIERLRAELQAAREALDLERLKSEAFANMSHEMRTLLAGVIGITALLLDTELSVDQRDHAKRIRASGDALLSIINNILDFAKIDRGALEIESADLDVRRCVEEVGDLLAERAHTKDVELCTFIAPDIPPALRGDPVRMRQVLLNLVSNAIKFTDEGEVVIRASLAAADGARPEDGDDAVMVRFEVEDTGVGISEAGRSRLFQPFAQVDGSALSHGGTGLGLAIAKRLVQAMGGEMGVESEVGKGSTFFCTVRFGRAKAAAERGVIPRIDLQGRRVIVVGATSTCRSVVEQLGPLGIEARVATDGASAIQTLRAAAGRGEPYDVAIIDTNLPDMDGPTLAREIGEPSPITATRIALMTPVGRRAPAGGDPPNILALLPKPIRHAQLLACLHQLMGPLSETVKGTRRMAALGGRGGGGGTAPRAVNGAPPSAPKVLVVEDNVINQKVAAFMLEKRGFSADVVKNGLEAVEAAARLPYAAVFMDCHMPKFDGFQATAMIRSRETAGRRMPIIAMTADVRAGARERCLAMGMDDYLSKPLVNEELDAALRRWCPRPAGEAPASARRPQTAALFATPPAPSATSPMPMALDVDAINKLRDLSSDGDPDLITEVIGLFLQEAPRRIAALRAASARGDAKELREIAHALKGSAGQLGARSVQMIAGRIEEIGRSGAIAGAALIDGLDAELQRARVAMNAELEKGKR